MPTLHEKTIIATEDAITFLERYAREESAEKRVSAILAELRGAGPEGAEVRRTQEGWRPLWIADIDEDNAIAFSIGTGAGEQDEVRVLYAGHRSSIPPDIELLAITNDLKSVSADPAPETVAASTSGYPAIPAARLVGDDFPLDAYLRPEKEQYRQQVEEVVDDLVSRGMEDLGRQRFRSLLSICEADYLPLRLGPKQEEMLLRPRPLLIQGVAGSGKTTVLTAIAHRAIAETEARGQHEPDHVLFCVYTERLKNYVDLLLRSLTGGPAHGAGADGVRVLPYRALCDYVAERCGLPRFLWANPDTTARATMRVLRSEAELSSHITIRELLEEIRVCIKGQNVEGDSPLISREQYVSGGCGELHADESIRASIYTLAEKYQEHLTKLGQVDEMDAARMLLRLRESTPKWGHVLVDEAQDYSLVQLAFLTSLAEDEESVVYAGDEHQVVHASQFSWQRVRDAIWHLGYSGDHPLSEIATNYRNTRPILELGQAILDHRSSRLGLPPAPNVRSDRPLTPRPIRVKGSRAQRRALVSDLARTVPSLGVIYPTQEQADHESKKYQGVKFRRGFSPQAAKGLEFEVVCLVDFGRHYADLVNKRMGRSASSVRLQFNQLYVSVTRARKLLVVVEEGGGKFWEDDHYSKRFELADHAAAVGAAASEATALDKIGWRLAAMDFENQQAWEAAVECWTRAEEYTRAGDCARRLEGNTRLAIELYQLGDGWSQAAELHEDAGDLESAAKAWSSAGEHRRSAICWERAAEFSRAADEWGRAHDRGGELRARALFAERHENYGEAADCWEAHGSTARAAGAAEQASQFERAADLWARAGSDDRATRARAQHLEREQDFNGAAEAWTALNDYARAAASLMQAERFREAARFYRRAGSEKESNYAEGRHQLARGAHRSAAELFMRAGRYEDAAAAYARAGSQGEELRATAFAREQSRDFEEAASLWLRLGNHPKAAQAWQHAGRYAQAATFWSESGRHDRAAECWERAGDYDSAFEAWRLGGDPRRARLAHAMGLQASGDTTEAAHAFLAERQWERAATCFEKARDFEEAAQCWTRKALDVEDKILTVQAHASKQELKKLRVERMGYQKKAAHCVRRARLGPRS